MPRLLTALDAEFVGLQAFARTTPGLVTFSATSRRPLGNAVPPSSVKITASPTVAPATERLSEELEIGWNGRE
jgi:hypothetical protein